jgi:hypothetical protein
MTASGPSKERCMLFTTRWMLMPLIAVALQGTLSPKTRGIAAQAPSAADAIACRVIESKTAPALRVGLVIFHHAETASRERLATFLEEHDGATVEFETEGGEWQPAIVFRLKSCFGRGLLAFPAERARLARGQTFLIRASAPGQRVVPAD